MLATAKTKTLGQRYWATRTANTDTQNALPRKKPLKKAKNSLKTKLNTKTAQTSTQKQKSRSEENPTVAKQSSKKQRKG